MDTFHSSTRTWFLEHFEKPTPVQERGWPLIAGGAHALLAAPTGSGKTLAAFLWGIDRLSGGSEDPETSDPPRGVRLLYISPLKALVYDIERNLRAPLAGVRAAAQESGATFRDIRVDVRTGDTPQKDRRRQIKDPAEILVTTPESLYLMLGSSARETLRTVETVIVDEIHALAPTKRGGHLALSLERLAHGAKCDPQRIGLSATARPLEDVARFLGGDRSVEVVDATAPPRLALRISVPVPDMTRPTPPPSELPSDAGAPPTGPRFEKEARETGPSVGDERGLWPAIYPRLLEEIRANRSTILFVNSRGLCERLTGRLNEVAGEDLVFAHHGSVSHERRAQIEDRLKRGEIRAIVATSSLELGIDMGSIDRVLLVESPGSVARGLQRVGRAGHDVGARSEGVLYPKFRGDLLECAVVAERMLAGKIEATQITSCALDVLSQQIVAMCCEREWQPAEIERVVRRSAPYSELSREALNTVLDMLSGRYPGNDLADLRPRLRWDRAADVLSPRRGSELVTRLNAGTIPDRGSFGVHLGEGGPRIGELDEEMVYESRKGDTFLLGASTWRVEELTRDRVIVSPAPGEPGRMPFWHGEGPGRPLELGRAMGAFTRKVGDMERAEAFRYLTEELPLDDNAANNLLEHLAEQVAMGSAAPTDREIVVERFRDELGDWRVCILSPYGSRVHAPWAMALRHHLGNANGIDAEVLYTDDGIVLRLADTEELPGVDELFPGTEDLEDAIVTELGKTSLFAALFRENAVRSLLLTRRRPDQRNPLWAQRLKAKALLSAVHRFPDFPIVLETYRQAMSEVFDIDGLREILTSVQTREVRVREYETTRASPFARSLVFDFIAAHLYEGDSPLAERKAQALTLDRGLLSELVGQPVLSELLDATAVAAVTEELAGRAPERRARDRDELEDLLRRVGELSIEEAVERSEAETEEVRAWLHELQREVRAAPVRVAGKERWIAAEDAGLYRDALGCDPPSGLPSDYLESKEDSLEALVRRFARSNGPFFTRDVAGRFGLREAQILPALKLLEAQGALIFGEIRPGGGEHDWCDADVLRRLKRRTLAKLRGEVSAVDGETFARFLASWSGVEPRQSGRDRLEEALASLEGMPLPWSTLVDVILPARVPGFRADELDVLGAQGRFVWIGVGSLGTRDGRVAIHRRDTLADLVEAAPEAPDAPDALATRIHELLRLRGASFTTEIERALRKEVKDLPAEDFEQALWDLAWQGLITNDTFQPLSQLRRPTRGGTRSRFGAQRARAGAPTGGRWSLVEHLLDETVTPTERALARAHMLLERYGVVSKEAAHAEDIRGGFAGIYDALLALEDAGRVRRGYFVEGLSGAQFAAPAVIDRLRDAREDGRKPVASVLAATDPANPWGALFPWPHRTEDDKPRARRTAGAMVVCVSGAPVLWVPPGRRNLVSFPSADDPGVLAIAFEALCSMPKRGKLLLIEKIDGSPIAGTPFENALLAAGFVADYRGFLPAPETKKRAE